jgi:hypothetical protein
VALDGREAAPTGWLAAQRRPGASRDVFAGLDSSREALAAMIAGNTTGKRLVSIG